MKSDQSTARVWIRVLVALTVLVSGSSARSKAEDSTPAARVVMYLVGRAFLNPNNGQGEVVGYITDINGIPGPLFDGPPSESTAFFTFRSDIFSLRPLPTNGDIGLNLVSRGTLSLYLNTNPAGDWSNPDTFSSGQRIATFKRPESLFIQIGPASSHVLSESLAFSSDFDFAGKKFDFDRLASGITISEFISNRPIPGVQGYPVGLPFAANAVVVETR